MPDKLLYAICICAPAKEKSRLNACACPSAIKFVLGIIRSQAALARTGTSNKKGSPQAASFYITQNAEISVPCDAAASWAIADASSACALA
jgi:hypothetical protein